MPTGKEVLRVEYDTITAAEWQPSNGRAIRAIMAIEQERIQKSLNKVRKFAKNVPKQPTPEQIHKLRTSARKMEAMFGALSLDSRGNEHRLLRIVRKLRKRAGKVRDLDVLTGHLAGVHADGESECEVQLLEHLGSERDRQVGKLRNLVAKHRAELKTRVRKASAEIESVLQNDSRTPASRAAAHVLQLSSELGMPKHLNKRNLHPYRLKVKELRYVLQMAPSADSKFVEELGKVKDTIGEWHDWEELISIANEVLGHGPHCKLIRRLREISDSKYQEAVGSAEGMRKRYIHGAAQKKPSGHVALKPAVVGTIAQLSA